MPTMAAQGLDAVWTLAYLFATTLMVAELIAVDGAVQRALRWKPLAGIGRLSYGMYLFHFFPLFVAQRLADHLSWTGGRPYVSFALAAVGSIVAAHLLAVTVERPCVGIGKRLSARLMQSGGPAVRTMVSSEARLPSLVA